MRYAIISDVHGNLHGLNAVIRDAKNNNADRYLLLGDYFLDCPFPNEVVDTIRALPEASVIKGNKDDYLLRLSDNVLCLKQMAAARWNIGQLKAENKDYLMRLPDTVNITDNDITIHLMHSSDIFFRKTKIEPFYSSWFRCEMRRAPFNHEDYLTFAYEALLSRGDALNDIEALPTGIYLFGHNHLQFHAEYCGRIFINPGSCGVPLDCEKTAAYTLLDMEGPIYHISERRVAYDIEKAVEGVKSSAMAVKAPVWCRLIEKVILDGQDYFDLFLKHVYRTAQQIGDAAYPVSDNSWDRAVDDWDFDNMRSRCN